MRRAVAASLAVLVGALGGCGGADDSGGDQLDADGSDSGARETAFETEAEDTTPDAELETEAETGIDADAEAEAAPTCTDEEVEPNDTAPEAIPLATIDDCDSSGSTLHGVLSSSSDVDYWHFQGNDTFGCSVDPTVSTSQSIRLCVFVACLHGATRVNGCTKGDPFASQAGLHGCCVDGPGDAVVDFTCTLVGSDDSADVYIRAEDPTASSTCERYDVDYHF